MKIYSYKNTDKFVTRYGKLTSITENIPICIVRINQITDLILRKSLLQNRPFKVLYYVVYAPYRNIYMQQEIITNHKYFPKRKEYIDKFRYEIYNNKLKFIFSKLDVLLLYRILNHFIRKNSKNSIKR